MNQTDHISRTTAKRIAHLIIMRDHARVALDTMLLGHVTYDQRSFEKLKAAHMDASNELSDILHGEIVITYHDALNNEPETATETILRLVTLGTQP